MALIRKCDKCGKEMVNSDMLTNSVSYYAPLCLYETKVDLCKQCFLEFKEYLQGKKEAE